MLSGVLFDLDDTLVDQASAARRAVIAWADEHGQRAPDLPERWAAISEAHYASYQRREVTFQQQRRKRVREFLGVAATDAEADQLFEGYLVRYEGAWAVFNDAVPALERARQVGLRVAVLTNGDEVHQRLKVDQLRLTDAIDVLISTSSLPAGKPDRQAFLYAAECLELPVQQLLMVGNSLETDVHGALAAGLHAVLLDRNDEHQGVDVRRVRTLHELNYSV